MGGLGDYWTIIVDNRANLFTISAKKRESFAFLSHIGSIIPGGDLMYRLILTLLFTLMASFSAQAGRASVEFLAHNLNLDEQQRVKVESVMAMQYKMHKALRREGNANCDNKKKMWLATRTRMYEILNADQLTTFDKLQKKRQRSCSLKIQKVADNGSSLPL